MLYTRDKLRKNGVFVILIFVLLVFVFLFYYLTVVFENQNSYGCKYCLDPGNCKSNFSETSLGEFVKIPGGYFILPKNPEQKRTGYDLDSVYINSFQIGVEKVTIDAYNGALCSNDNINEHGNGKYYIRRLSVSDVGYFLFKVNQLAESNHYRIPNDVEWMYAYQYLNEIEQSPIIPSDVRIKFQQVLSSFTEEPFEICSWEGSKAKGDTISNFSFSEDMLSSKGAYITKGDKESIFNRDMGESPSGIRLVRY